MSSRRKLYKVTMTAVVEIPIVATGLDEAKKVGRDVIYEEVENRLATDLWELDNVSPVETVSEIPEDWRGTCPYDGDSRTVDEWVTEESEKK